MRLAIIFKYGHAGIYYRRITKAGAKQRQELKHGSVKQRQVLINVKISIIW